MSTTAHPKQTLHETPALIALGEALHLLPHHTKPFRRRHLLFLAVAIVFVSTMFVELGAVITRRSLDPRTLFTQAATSGVVNRTTVVRSSQGFAFSFNNEQFTVQARGEHIDGNVSDADLKRGAALDSVVLSPLPSFVPGPEAAAEFESRVENDAAAFATFKSKAVVGKDMTAVTADYFAPPATSSADIVLESRAADTLGGTSVTKSVYKVTPKFAGNPTHTIVWTTQIEGRPLAITIRGIVVGSEVPTSMTPILASLKLSSDAKVEGISTLFGNDAPAPVLDQKYVADLVSPAVVKIYHVVCGTVVYQGKVLSTDTCSGATGSGFIVSSDGYIATNGHVVVYGAKDLLVNALLSNQTLLAQFLSGSTMSPAQIKEVISRPELTASVVSRVYDLPDKDLRFSNERQLTAVALGAAPLEVKTEQDVKDLAANFTDKENLRRADVIGFDYSAKDQLTVVADPKKGFSASDVALIKISGKNLPVVKLSSAPVTLNQKISVFGFPGDADNELTDNSKLNVTVTNGAISSIRDAAGNSSKLYQSDADASHGNSGGPAVNDEGEAFGLLTYRFASGDSADAAKSYIRDIADFKQLVKDKGVTLNTSSQTELNWRKGLDLYSKHHYSAALSEFKKVKELYPSHRLAGTYIGLSEQAISEGKDVKEPSVILLTLGAGAGLGGLGLAVVMIARHHGRHQVYKAFHRHSVVATAH